MIGQVLLLLLAGILVAAALAPFSALSWWARQDPRATRRELAAILETAQSRRTDDDPHPAWIVYMTGVGAVDEAANPVGERPFLDDLAASLAVAIPEGTVPIVSDVYPYDVANRGLLKGRGSAFFWRRVRALSKTRWLRLAIMLVYLRNVMQFAVSADDRYGPLYSVAIGRVVYDRLLAAGYDPASRRPVVMLGWSGGAQVALAACTALSAAGMPVYLVSVGGVLTSDPGLGHVRFLWHLKGTKDRVQAIGQLFPGRWPSRRRSAWAVAEREGRIQIDVVGDQQHLGRGSYLSRAPFGDGRTYRQVTVDEVTARIVDVVARERRETPGAHAAR